MHLTSRMSIAAQIHNCRDTPGGTRLRSATSRKAARPSSGEPLRSTPASSFTGRPPSAPRLRSRTRSFVTISRAAARFPSRSSGQPGVKSVVRQEKTLLRNI